MKISNVTTDENGQLSGLLKDQNYILVQVGNHAQVKTNLQPAARIGSSGSRHVLSVTEIIPDSAPVEAPAKATVIPAIKPVVDDDEEPKAPAPVAPTVPAPAVPETPVASEATH